MCPLSLHESPSGSVMTGCSAGRVQQSRHLSHPQPRQPLSSVPRTPSSRGRLPAQKGVVARFPSAISSGPTLAATAATVLSAHTDDKRTRRRSAWHRGRCCPGASWIDVLTQVRNLRVPCLLILLLVLSLHSQPVMCSLQQIETVTHVIYKTKLCRPVPVETLKASLCNGHGNPHDIQADDSNAGWGLSQSPFDDARPPEEKGSDKADKEDDELFHQKKEFEFGLNLKAEYETDVRDDDDDEEEDDEEEEEEEMWEKDRWDGGAKGRTLSRALFRGKHHGGHRRAERHLGVSDAHYGKGSTDWRDAESPDSYSMRRRRRRRALEPGTNPKGSRLQRASDVTRKSSDSSGGGKGRNGRMSSYKSRRKSDDLQITSLQLSTKRNNRKIRKKLRKEFRQLVKKQNKPPPWECKFTRITSAMLPGIYPTSIHDGRCESNKCFFNLYACEPIKYAVEFMKRDPSYCNPLPLEGNVTVYEEAWEKVTKHVTVGCKCASLAASGRRRRRN